MTTAVFFDTNVLLSFFEVSKSNIKKFTDILLLGHHQEFQFFTTGQIQQEFQRRRSSVIASSIKTFSEVKIPGVPVLAHDLEGEGEFKEAREQFNVAHRKLADEMKRRAIEKDLATDALIDKLFYHSVKCDINPSVELLAQERVNLGHPPGKRGSMGDAINWEALLNFDFENFSVSLPRLERIVLVSDDIDFKDPFEKGCLRHFLRDEWIRRQNIRLEYIEDLAQFSEKYAQQHNLDVFSSTEHAISSLAGVKSFRATHAAIAELATVKYFSAKQVNYLIEILDNNYQVKSIFQDTDVFEFYSFLANSFLDKISQSHLTFLKEMDEYDGNGAFPTIIPF